MTKKYQCDLCHYETDRLFNYDKHISTKSHVCNEENYAVTKQTSCD